MKNYNKTNTYAPTEKLLQEMKNVSSSVGPWVQENYRWFQEQLTTAIQKNGGITNHYPIIDGPCSTIIVSPNYGNESHYDINDDSLTMGIWVEEKPNTASNWFFILPNVSYRGSIGVAIEIVHGRCIIWDGKKVRHLTSVTEVGVDNNVYGAAFLSSNS